MKIILNIIDVEFCAQVYVIAEENEKEFDLLEKNERHSTRCVKIWHNRTQQSMLPAKEPKRYHNDIFIVFESNVPYQDFCKAFVASKYHLPENYNIITQNCAEAAYFALKLAGIDFPINRFLRLTRLNVHSFFKFPPIVLTAADLYHYAKAHKLKLMKQPSSSYASFLLKMQTVQSECKTRSWKTDIVPSKAQNDMEIIMKEIDHAMTIRPHHIELYLKALNSGLNLITFKSNSDEYLNYLELSNQFKERQESLIPRLNNLILLFVLGCFLYYRIKPYVINEDLNVVEDTILPMISGLLSTLMFRAVFTHFYPTDKEANVKPTKLSKAMHNLVEDFLETELAENKREPLRAMK